MRVRDIMSCPVIVVSPDQPLKDVVSLFDEHGISAIPVVEEGRVAGIVSKTDVVIREQAFELDGQRRALGGGMRRRRRPETVRTAGGAMTAPAVTVDAATSAVGAAWLMAEHDVHHLPALDRGELVGIVSRSDLVRAFARSDDQIRAEIVDEVLPALDVSPSDVTVAVVNGDVVLAGYVDEAVARCLPHAVRAVIGVVDVRVELETARAHTGSVRLSRSRG